MEHSAPHAPIATRSALGNMLHPFALKYDMVHQRFLILMIEEKTCDWVQVFHSIMAGLVTRVLEGIFYTSFTEIYSKTQNSRNNLAYQLKFIAFLAAFGLVVYIGSDISNNIQTLI
ncbi:hypothetical protein ACJX0J_021568 [Zea mays]